AHVLFIGGSGQIGSSAKGSEIRPAVGGCSRCRHTATRGADRPFQTSGAARRFSVHQGCGIAGGEEVSLRADRSQSSRSLSLRDRSSHGVEAESARKMTLFRLLCAVLAMTSLVSAQAWLSPKGEGTVSLSYQNMFVSDHVYENGDAHDIGHILS